MGWLRSVGRFLSIYGIILELWGLTGWEHPRGVTLFDWTDPMDTNLSKFRELVMDKEAWRAAAHGVAKSRTRLSDWTELNWLVLVVGWKLSWGCQLVLHSFLCVIWVWWLDFMIEHKSKSYRSVMTQPWKWHGFMPAAFPWLKQIRGSTRFKRRKNRLHLWSLPSLKRVDIFNPLWR